MLTSRRSPATPYSASDDGAQPGTKVDVALPPGTDLTGVTVSMAPTQSFVTSGDRDQFFCTVLDPQLAQGAWMTGMQIKPGSVLTKTGSWFQVFSQFRKVCYARLHSGLPPLLKTPKTQLPMSITSDPVPSQVRAALAKDLA